MGAIRLVRVGQGNIRGFNVIAVDSTPYQLFLDGLLISGFQVRVLGGSPTPQITVTFKFSSRKLGTSGNKTPATF